MWRFKSWTILLGIGLVIYGLLSTQYELIGIGLANVALREKTERKWLAKL